MTLHVSEGVVVEAAVICVLFIVSLALYIILPELNYPDYLQCPFPEPTSWPLKAIWARLPMHIAEELKKSTRLPLAMVWAVCAVGGTALGGATVGLWRTDRLHEASMCLFSWQALIICCVTLVEILQILYPACRALATRASASEHQEGAAWCSWWFPFGLTAHASWLAVGIWLAQLELLVSLTTLTHFCSLVPGLYIAVTLDRNQADKHRMYWWTGTVVLVCVASLAASLVTIRGWRTGHLAAQYTCSTTLVWEKAVWKFYLPPSQGSNPIQSQSQGPSQGGSIQSTTGLVPTTEGKNEDRDGAETALDALTEHFVTLIAEIGYMLPTSDDQDPELATPQQVDNRGRMVISNTGKGMDMDITVAASCDDTDANPTPINLRVPPDPYTSPADASDTVGTKVCLGLVSEALKAHLAKGTRGRNNDFAIKV